MVRNAILSDTAGPHTQRVAVQLRWRGPGSRVSVCGGRRVAVRRNEEGRRGARERRRRTSSWSALAWRRESSSGANKPDSAECRRSGAVRIIRSLNKKIIRGKGLNPLGPSAGPDLSPAIDNPRFAEGCPFLRHACGLPLMWRAGSVPHAFRHFFR
jgi:hypothetical protein